MAQPLSAVIPVPEEGEKLVSEDDLGSVFIDVGNRDPLTAGRAHPSGGGGGHRRYSASKVTGSLK